MNRFNCATLTVVLSVISVSCLVDPGPNVSSSQAELSSEFLTIKKVHSKYFSQYETPEISAKDEADFALILKESGVEPAIVKYDGEEISELGWCSQRREVSTVGIQTNICCKFKHCCTISWRGVLCADVSRSCKEVQGTWADLACNSLGNWWKN